MIQGIPALHIRPHASLPGLVPAHRHHLGATLVMTSPRHQQLLPGGPISLYLQ